MDIGTIIVLVTGLVFMLWFPSVPALLLKRKFDKLGSYKGKSFEEIKSVVGEPTYKNDKIKRNGIDCTQMEWEAAMYKVSLIFSKSDEICLGIEGDL